MKIYLKICFIYICCITNLYADIGMEKGISIAKQIELHDQGWGDASVSYNMLLRNQHGDESTRDLRIKILEVIGDGDKSLTIFDTPRDIKGTSFLSHSHVTKVDDQWLYLPALKRVKRITSGNKSGPFMGSQFSYEDLASFEVGKYSYKYLRDEVLNGFDSFVVENYPNYQFSGYTRQIVWVDKERYIPLKIEYYDRKDELLKTLTFKKYKQHLGKYWRAYEQVMENKQNGKITILTLNYYQFSNNLSESDFNRNNLKRAR